MKEEYDFSKGERGKFYKPDLELRIPVYLQKDIIDFLQKIASEKGTDVETIVNDWLRRNISLVETTK
jgi:hypothetical protein